MIDTANTYVNERAVGRAMKRSGLKREEIFIEHIKEILSICGVKPAIFQTEAHPYFQEKELKEYPASAGIAIQAWYPLDHGALIEEPIFSKLAQKFGKTNAQIVLRWHIQAGNIVIPGSKNPAHIKDNFDLFDFALAEVGKCQRSPCWIRESDTTPAHPPLRSDGPHLNVQRS